MAKQKWQFERQEKLAEVERSAITLALEWIDPMRNAEIQASSLLMAAIHGDINDEHFLGEFPYIVGELKKLDLSGAQRAVLSNSIYKKGITIYRELEEIGILGVKYGQEVRRLNRPLIGFEECNKKLNTVSQLIDDLEDDLQKKYHDTFS